MFLGGAALLVVAAAVTGPRSVEQEAFKDEGTLLFPAFTDPLAANELEIAEFREASKKPYRFIVKRDDAGRWIIPSHGGYPADAKQRMGEAASMVIGLRKDRLRSDQKEKFGEFGVVDPLDPDPAETKGRGRRITFRDKAGNVLGDLIIGKDVENKSGVHFVRIADKRQVYESKFTDQVSAKFADWIETDLLKAQSWDIAEVLFDNYKVDVEANTITPGEKILVKKDEATSKWTVDGQKDDEQPNDEKINEITRTLGEIKIVGVRRKPEGLTGALRQANGVDRMLIAQALAEKGYYLTRDGMLVSNEGDLVFKTRKGIVYTLKFGQVAPGEGDDLTAGKDEPKGKAEPKEPAKDAPAGTHRYLMVTVEFDPSLLKKPTSARLPDDELKKRSEARTAIEAIVHAVDAYRSKHDKALPESLAKLTEKPADGEAPLKELKKDPWDQDYVLEPQGEGFVVRSKGGDKADGGDGIGTDVRSDALAKEDELRRAADEWKEFDKKTEDGKKEGENLGKRFGSWYYVIDADLFAKLKPARKDLVKPKDKPPEKPADKAGDKAGDNKTPEKGDTPPPANGGTGK
jgi:hypothetical protein